MTTFPQVRASFRAVVYMIRCKTGIALKLAGCALIHGRGRHCWGGPVMEYRQWRTTACTSCGKYRHIEVGKRP